MKIQKKRNWLLCTLALLLLISFYLYFLFPQNETLRLTKNEDENLLELHLTAGEIIKGWKKEDIVYFFVPSYVTVDRIALDTGLKWAHTDFAKTALEYDTVQEILLCDPENDVPAVTKICFKHSANLHTIFMDLKTGAPDSITKDAFVETAVRVVTPDGDIAYNEPGNFVKGRGNSTWEVDKKPYYLKLSKKTGLCGMEPDKKWILMANAYEATKITNKLFYDFSEDAGLHFSADSEWADLYINGEYRGNYLVCEKIDVGTNRIDIDNLEKENERICKTYEPYTEESIRGYLTAQSDIPPDISGGYIIEKDVTIADSPCGFVTEDGSCFVITSPDNAPLEEVTYIRDHFQNIENLLNQQDPRVLQYIDTDSFARRFLIEETVLNSDAFITSWYFYKKRGDDKIYAGPIWDYDSVLGESNTVEYPDKGNVWLNYDETTVFSMGDNRLTIAVLSWDEQLYELPEYRDILKKTYVDMLPQLETLLYKQIDLYANQVRQSVALDSIRWNYAENMAGHYSSFDNNIRYMKFFLAKRINFVNRRLGLEEYPYEDNPHSGTHNVTCVIDTQKTKISIEDGSFINPDMLPEYDREKYEGWIYEWDKTPLSEFLPVYEDITLYLQ